MKNNKFCSWSLLSRCSYFTLSPYFFFPLEGWWTEYRSDVIQSSSRFDTVHKVRSSMVIEQLWEKEAYIYKADICFMASCHNSFQQHV